MFFSISEQFPEIARITKYDALDRLQTIAVNGLQFHGNYQSIVSSDEVPTIWVVNLDRGDVFAAGLVEGATLEGLHKEASNNRQEAVETLVSVIDSDWTDDMNEENRLMLGTACWLYIASTSSFERSLKMIQQGQANGKLDCILLVHKAQTKEDGTDLRPAIVFDGVDRNPVLSAMTTLNLANQVLKMDRAKKTGWYGRGLR